MEVVITGLWNTWTREKESEQLDICKPLILFYCFTKWAKVVGVENKVIKPSSRIV